MRSRRDEKIKTNSVFTSRREKQLWIWAFVVFIAIFSTLFLGQPLANLFKSQDVQAAVFVFVMVLIGVLITLHARNVKPGKIEFTIWLGIAAVYSMFFLRLGMPERSHLMEYSVLAIFIHKAIAERAGHSSNITMPALLAFVICFLIGVLDECLQIFLPNRVFDPADILFNGLATMMAIGAAVVLNWLRKQRSRKA